MLLAAGFGDAASPQKEDLTKELSIKPTNPIGAPDKRLNFFKNYLPLNVSALTDSAGTETTLTSRCQSGTI